MTTDTKNIGIIGLGYWGPNWLRNLSASESWNLTMACDAREEQCAKFQSTYPAVEFVTDHSAMLSSDKIDAVIIATPTSTHFSLAKEAMEHGKHVLVEKPMTGSVREAEELVKIAKEKNVQLLVGHTFAYTSAVEKIHEMTSDNMLGDLLYFDSTRINLGLIQKDTNVLWDLAIHDLSILAQIADMTTITEVFAHGTAHYGNQVEDAHLYVRFQSGLDAHIHVSWLSPVKLRQTIVGGKNMMIVYNDIEPSEKIRIYDKGVEHDDTKADPFFPKYRSGDVLIPALKNAEPLAVEAAHFAECVHGNAQPRVSGEDGLAMIRILDAANRSLESNSPVSL